MKHYGFAQWVDFTREFIPPEYRRGMEDHLAGGCARCQDTLDFCSRLTNACHRIGSSAVPNELVLRAKAIFPPRSPERPKRVVRIFAELVYDSFLVPSPAGLRSTWQIGWQSLFHAGDCSVDLRVEPELRSLKASLVGQISNRVMPGTAMNDVPVYLKAGKLVVAETRSNRFGEFQMDYQQQGRLQLCIYLDGGSKCIQVPLKKLMPDKPFSRARLNRTSADRNPRGDEPQ
jgi:hypothetical protein